MGTSTKVIIGLLATCLTSIAVVATPSPPSTAVLLPAPAQTPPEKVDIVEPAIKRLLSENKKYSSETISFYKENGYILVWTSGSDLNKFGQIALDVLKDAASEGLNPENYTQTLTAQQNKLSAEEIDIILTNEFIGFVANL